MDDIVVKETETPPGMRKQLAVSGLKALGARQFRFRASDATIDRDHDRVNPAGWDLSAFKQSPVILWAHDHAIPAIARAVDVRVERDALMVTIEFPPAGIHPLADQVHDLIQAGFLTAVSVGFRPGRATRNNLGGADIAEQELIEISVVNVPANPSAVLVNRRATRAAITKWLGGDDQIAVSIRDDDDDQIAVVLREEEDEIVRAASARLAAAQREALAAARRAISNRDPFRDPFVPQSHRHEPVMIDRAMVIATCRELVPGLVRDALRTAIDEAFRRARGRVD